MLSLSYRKPDSNIETILPITSSKASKKTQRKSRTKRLSPEERLLRQNQRKFHREFRNFFRELGFSRVNSDRIQVNIKGRNGELDDIFLKENIIIITEYTLGKPDSSHILKKKPLFDKIIGDVPSFLQVAKKTYPDFSKLLNDVYDDTHYHLRIIYAPLQEASQETINTCPDVTFLQGGLQKYFFALGKTIQRSACVEFFSYLKLNWNDVGSGALTASTQNHEYSGQLLPASMSSFPAGYKVVSFYADPESLIAGAYVLRRDGWRDSSHLYQRVLVRGKIAKMRRYLIDQKRVFVNNVIVTLPSDTALNDPTVKGINVPKKELNKARSVTVSIPAGYSVIGIIDGQHRIFCYHEGDDVHEPEIAKLRKRQHLLVTGIIFPKEILEEARLEFEARLFLEINDTQTRTRSALRQDIETIVRPFSGIAVARRVIAQLAKNGPYGGLFQLAYFDSSAKIKTSSIVSYGLRPLLKFDGDDSLFFAWKEADKNRLKKPSMSKEGHEQDIVLLERYIEFCVKNLNDFFLAAKLAYGPAHWDVEDKTPSPLLRPTSINGLIACLRRVIQHKMPLTPAAHKKAMVNLSAFKFDSYKSSRWDALGDALFEKHYDHAKSLPKSKVQRRS